MSVWPVTGWQTICDYPDCRVVGPRRWEWSDALAAWLDMGGLDVGAPPGVIPGRGSAVRHHLTMCPDHAVTVCCGCGTSDALVVTDLEARRSWCADCWTKATGAKP
jgi:hypothetical protein